MHAGEKQESPEAVRVDMGVGGCASGLSGAFNEDFRMGFTHIRKARYTRLASSVGLGCSQKRAYFARSLAWDYRHISVASFRGPL